jgi:ABC-type transport system involved in multi-copper enzyme maturation permease subunit
VSSSHQVLVMAGITVREALRRRLVAAFAGISIVLVSVSAWGFDRLSHSSGLTSGEVQVSVPQSLILFMFMFSFVVALSASAMSSPAIASDVESGVLLAVATRPIRRTEIVLGKWAGLVSVLALYVIVVCALEFLVVKWVSGFAPPNPFLVGAYLLGEGVVLLTLALALSTRLSTLAAGVTAIAVFGAAWLGGVVGALGAGFHITALSDIGGVARILVPTDGLWHGAIYYLEPGSLVVQRLGAGIGDKGDPFFASSPPTWSYLVWSLAWFALVLAAGVFSFQRREL